ncbi:MAG: LacI family transcriptional regulator [Anaerolineae bacterium]|nr:LacI family transcriptional regulator [Anaerolineae bacterium]NUQ05632.1 LacI family DNA-binding transcriptional regulator [Anaerolineae bacterium]
MTTIRDVAKRAGVSVTTASYALNDTGSIGEATRKRVLEAAEELNFHPNAFARNLKRRKTQTIGVFISRFSGSFYEEILEGIHSVILETDYELLVCPESRSTRRILLHRQVDGAIVFDRKITNEQVLKLASRRFPIVVLDRDLQNDFILPLLLDNAQGVREAFRHLYDQGLRRMAFVAGALDALDNAERMETFLAEAKRKRLQVPVYQGNFTEVSGYDAARLIFQSAQLPQAVFCANDQMAFGFLRAMTERGLRAPAAIAIVGFDDIPLARHMQPSLSTIGASRFEWGATAVRQLIDLLDNETPFQPLRLSTRFLARQSSTLNAEPQTALGGTHDPALSS